MRRRGVKKGTESASMREAERDRDPAGNRRQRPKRGAIWPGRLRGLRRVHMKAIHDLASAMS